jgi:hypothetical protein
MPSFLPKPPRAAAVADEASPIVSPCGRTFAAATLAAGPAFAPIGAVLQGGA